MSPTNSNPSATGAPKPDMLDLLARFAPSELLPDDLPAEPWDLFKQWYDHAWNNRVQPNANAMTLACLDEHGTPTARIVLCKGMNLQHGFLVFHTNYLSRKGRGIAKHNRVALIFHWDTLDRQIRIEGPTTRSPKEESDEYFRTRSWDRRIGAWASQQSQPLKSREDMLAQVMNAMESLGISLQDIVEKGDSIDIPRPPHWGGTRVWADRVELWLGGSSRVHDRAVWSRTLTPAKIDDNDSFTGGPWSATRLNP